MVRGEDREEGSLVAAYPPPLSLFTSFREREGGNGSAICLGHTGHTSHIPVGDTGVR